TPTVQISPASVSFTAQNVGATSAIQTISVTNNGTNVLALTSISLGGTNPGDFFQSNNCPIGGNLGISSSCTISVTFTPITAGARSATISLVDNAADSPQSVALSGNGVQPTFSTQFGAGVVPKGNYIIK